MLKFFLGGMGVPSGLLDTIQSASFRALELVAIRQTLLSAVPTCPAVSLACPPANISCPAVSCSPPVCPAPLVNLSCPSFGAGAAVEGIDLPSAFWGAIAGLSAGVGLSGATWRRGRVPEAREAVLGDRARDQVRLLRLRNGDAR